MIYVQGVIVRLCLGLDLSYDVLQINLVANNLFVSIRYYKVSKYQFDIILLLHCFFATVAMQPSAVFCYCLKTQHIIPSICLIINSI